MTGLLAGGSALAQTHSLEFSDPTALEVALSEAKAPGQKSVVIENHGPALKDVRFTAIAGSADSDVKVVSDRSTIGADTAERFDLTFQASSDKTTKGTLLVAAGGQVAPDTRPVQVTVPQQLDRANTVVLGSLAAALLFMLILLPGVRDRLSKPLGPANWNFKDSWASNLTVVAAILGTVLASGVLTEPTRHLPKATYAGLNVMFGVIAVIAGIAYLAVRRATIVETDHGKELQYQGYVWTFCVASTMTLWAVFGQLGTLGIVLDEIRAQGSLSRVPVAVFTGVLVIAAVAVLLYAWTTINATVSWQTDETERGKVKTEQAARLQAQYGNEVAAAQGEPRLEPVSIL